MRRDRLLKLGAVSDVRRDILRCLDTVLGVGSDSPQSCAKCYSSVNIEAWGRTVGIIQNGSLCDRFVISSRSDCIVKVLKCSRISKASSG